MEATNSSTNKAFNCRYNKQRTAILLSGGVLALGGGNIKINSKTIAELTNNTVTDMRLESSRGVDWYKVVVNCKRGYVTHLTFKDEGGAKHEMDVKWNWARTKPRVCKFKSKRPDIVEITLKLGH